MYLQSLSWPHIYEMIDPTLHGFEPAKNGNDFFDYIKCGEPFKVVEDGRDLYNALYDEFERLIEEIPSGYDPFRKSPYPDGYSFSRERPKIFRMEEL